MYAYVYSRGAIVMLVLLRLGVGWHFFSEGSHHLKDEQWTSAYFLQQAKGPLAPLYHDQVPDFHGWDQLLAVPLDYRGPSEEELQEAQAWQGAYSQRQQEAAAEGGIEPLEISPATPYGKWANRTFADWQRVLDNFLQIGLTEEQKEAATAAFVARRQLVAEYLEASEAEIAKFRRQLSRLSKWDRDPATSELPYHDQRIAQKRAEVNSMAAGWQSDLRGYEQALFNDLRDVLEEQQLSDTQIRLLADKTLVDGPSARLKMIDTYVSYVILGVGVLLVVGFLTPAAAVVGALFLLSVMASQPPWVEGANTQYFYYQLSECLALLTLAFTGAGRWAGIDFLFARTTCCGPKELKETGA